MTLGRTMLVALGLCLVGCGPRMEFTPHSAIQAQTPRACAFAVEVFEGDVAALQAAHAERLGKLEVSGSDVEPQDVLERAAEHGATQVTKVAQQRQLVQSGGMMIGTGGPGFSSGMMIPTTREETWTVWTLYRVPDQNEIPEGLRCPPVGR
jgi:hypothetical protein